MPIDLSTRLVQVAGLQSVRMDEDLVLLNMETSQYIALDDIGVRIWDIIQTPAEVSAICRRLETEFKAQPGQIEADVLAFLNELQAEKMVRIIEG